MIWAMASGPGAGSMWMSVVAPTARVLIRRIAVTWSRRAARAVRWPVVMGIPSQNGVSDY
ncbi:hypothetical protein Ppa05_54820 [Planomonospora parontospora subsp. antibiotica]|nr:hypothetical protein Ppa05_54820 [Planomonospora parontospora subsp. antibiotica]